MKEKNYLSQKNEYLRRGVSKFNGIVYCTYDLGNKNKVHVGPIVEEKQNCKMQLRSVIIERSIDEIVHFEKLELFCNEIEYLIERLKKDYMINVPVEMEAYNEQALEEREAELCLNDDCLYSVFEQETTEDD